MTVIRSRFQTGGSSTSAHFGVYDFIPQVLHAHPLFGLGLNNFSVYYQFVTGKTNWGPHSFYVALIVETGLVGTVVFAVFLWYLFRRLRAARAIGRALAAAGDPRRRACGRSAWGLTAALAGTLAANSFYLTMSFYYFYVLAMLVLAAPLVFGWVEGRVRTFNVAVSSRVGTAELKLRPDFGSKHRLVAEGEEQQPSSVGVPLTTLDTLVENGSLDPAQASLLWLDVEGHELEVLQGARQLVERSVPLVMEFVPRRLQDGRLAALGGVLAEHYTHVLDLRLPPGDDPDLRPLGELDGLAERYARGFTDLLVFRSPTRDGPERRP